MNAKEIAKLSREISAENGEREQRLRSKCEWEERTRCAILAEYGDPATWSKS
jgi:hypothetical protein